MEHNNIYDAVFKVNHAEGSGSCFFLKQYGIFVTNYHVIEGFREVGIQDNNKNSSLARVILANPSIDIALLWSEDDFSSLPEIKISDQEEIKIGQKINVAGYPYGMPFSLTEGTVSSPKQLMDNNYFIQTDAAVNPGNSGGPMFDDKNELVAITVSKLKDADNMGFGIPVAALKKILKHVGELDKTKFNVQCNSCDEFISDKVEYCPSCGSKLPDKVFNHRELTDLAVFCEEAISNLGINPILAREGFEYWKFYKGSSEIRMFIFERSYLYCTSPINILPKKDLEPVLTYMLSDQISPYQMGLDENQIFITYRIYLYDIMSDNKHKEEIKKNITNLAIKADELGNFMVQKYGCELSQFSKKEAVK